MTPEEATRNLLRAAEDGDLDAAIAALAAGADVNARSDWQITPLHLAVTDAHSYLTCLLIANHADVNATNEYGATPLHWAAEKGHANSVWLLIDNGANINARNESQQTPLDGARVRGNSDIVNLLEAAERAETGHEPP